MLLAFGGPAVLSSSRNGIGFWRRTSLDAVDRCGLPRPNCTAGMADNMAGSEMSNPRWMEHQLARASGLFGAGKLGDLWLRTNTLSARLVGRLVKSGVENGVHGLGQPVVGATDWMVSDLNRPSRLTTRGVFLGGLGFGGMDFSGLV